MSDIENQCKFLRTLFAKGQAGDLPLKLHNVAISLERQQDELSRLNAKISELEKVLPYIYYSAYHSGHHDTVEGNYTDVLYVDAFTYHADVVKEIIDSNVPGNK